MQLLSATATSFAAVGLPKGGAVVLNVYVGIDGDGFPGNFNPEQAPVSATPVVDGAQSVPIPTFVSTKYLVVAQPASTPLITSMMIDAVEQIQDYTLTSDAFSYQGDLYDAWTSNDAVDGSTLIGKSIDITR